MEVVLGSNDFFGVPFPLVLADRFFHVYDSETGFELDIFRWDEETKQAVYEVKAGESLNENINTNPTGIVTFGKSVRGVFIYRFRPKLGVSQILGKVPVEKEFEVRINDDVITVLVGYVRVVWLVKGRIVRANIGIQVGADGSVVAGVNKLPEGMILKRG